ncbi:hypothetical protein BH11PSE3_BH11PSE3_14750 [soil metagenome]
MKSYRSIIAIAVVAGALGGCASEGYYAPRSQATTYPATTTTYYGQGTTTTVSRPAVAAYTYDEPSYQKSNVYSSRADYNRNYQGIHDGPERTGP